MLARQGADGRKWGPMVNWCAVFLATIDAIDRIRYTTQPIRRVTWIEWH